MWQGVRMAVAGSEPSVSDVSPTQGYQISRACRRVGAKHEMRGMPVDVFDVSSGLRATSKLHFSWPEGHPM